MMEQANSLLDGYGIEHLMSENKRAEASYVNMGDPYTATVLLDMRRHAVYVTGYGSYVEKEERAGNRIA